MRCWRKSSSRAARRCDASVMSINRRQLLHGATGLTFMLAMGPVACGVAGENNNNCGQNEPMRSTWVRIDCQGIVTIYNPVAEMGQGSGTALPMIIAEEMDADWQDVRIEHSPIDAQLYGFLTRFGTASMMTAGSQAVELYFDKLRIAGAQIRQVLLQNAAAKLRVPVEELTTAASVVRHQKSNRQLKFGEIAAFATMPAALPSIDKSRLKPLAEFRLIGKTARRLDIPSKVDGSAQFAIDVKLPDMQYAMIQRSPVNGAAPLKFNAEQVQALDGVTAVIALEHGVGVVGKSTWAVLKARKVLQIQWTHGALAESFDSDKVFHSYALAAKTPPSTPKIVSVAGNVDAGQGLVAKTYHADYLNDFVYHAQIEPLNAVATVSADKKSAELWIGSQFPDDLKTQVASLLKVSEGQITIHPQYLGGGFGRRFWPDFGLEAVQLAAAAGVPVKLIWTREDDLQNGAFRPLTLQRLEAKLDHDGRAISWRHRVVGQNALNGMIIASSGARIPHYDIANQLIDQVVVPGGIRCGHWRAVGSGPNKFAIECFIDEICHGQGEDAYQFRRRLMHDSPRAIRVLDAAVEMSGYPSKPGSGTAMGLAFSEHRNSLSAGVVEISLDHNSGAIRVLRAWIAADAGLIVQPDAARSQLEGAIIQGISSALHESVSIKAGAVQQSNFHDYQILRITEVPEINIRIIPSVEPPTGIGELGVPFAGPAIANAFATLTGKRLRHMPFSSANVKKALDS